ncbi:MAG TPA: DNA polymerase III subunit gamma/tau [Thermodesulfobacteriota bacterium]
MSSYQVIARKWRPGVFDEVVGQAHVTRTLRNAISSGRIAHAYLFSGPRGVGKTTAARILAKCLNCSTGPTTTPCNECASCKGITGGSSVDVFEIDGASNNSVDNVREISESVRYVPAQGKYKVYIIDEVHMLSQAAFNALLKTLEEPPAHVIFIFATTEVHKIPATILSRCQRFDFKRIPLREIQSRLVEIATREGVKFEDKALYLIAREADGSMRDSQSLLEQVLSFSGGELREADVAEALGLMGRSVLYELSEAIIGKDSKACLNIVEKVYKFGYDFKRGCSDLLEHIRDLTVIKATGDTSLLDLPDSELGRLLDISGRVGIERLHMLFSILSKGYEEVSRSAHPRYALEMTLLRAAHLDELEQVSGLLERIEGIASRIGGAPQRASAPQTQTQGAAAASQAVPKTLPWKKEAPAVEARPAEARAAQPAKEAREKPVEKKEAAPPAHVDEKAGLLEFLEKRNPGLVESLRTVSVEIAGDTVTMKSPDERMQGRIKVNRAAVEATCRDFLKRPITLNLGDNEAAKKKEVDPVVMDALRIFGGRIIEDRRRSNV